MCDTIGIIPFYQNGLLYQFFVERGRVMDVIGDGPQAEKYRAGSRRIRAAAPSAAGGRPTRAPRWGAIA